MHISLIFGKQDFYQKISSQNELQKAHKTTIKDVERRSLWIKLRWLSKRREPRVPDPTTPTIASGLTRQVAGCELRGNCWSGRSEFPENFLQEFLWCKFHRTKRNWSTRLELERERDPCMKQAFCRTMSKTAQKFHWIGNEPLAFFFLPPYKCFPLKADIIVLLARASVSCTTVTAEQK